MTIIYFDCFSGISGDMTLGAFIDAGLKLGTLKRELGRLKVSGYALKARRVERNGITGTKFDCVVNGSGRGRGHRDLRAILRLIGRSGLSPRVKEISSEIFATIGAAEGKVHGRPSDKVHFHEVGGIDSIVDIVGCAIALDEFDIGTCYASEVALGKGSVVTEAGVYPVPAPATLEILRGVPVAPSPAEGELTTPTGAGILKTLCAGFGQMPAMTPETTGYGAGSRQTPGLPNMLRIVMGEEGGRVSGYGAGTVLVIETNIDDMNPQTFGYLFERLFKEGALDVYVTPIHMKKSRPAFTLSVLAEEGALERMASVIFSETTAFGLRMHRAERLMLNRKVVAASTRYGRIRVKIGDRGGLIRSISPEYDDCVVAARNSAVPFRTVYDAAKKAVQPKETGQ